MTLTEDESRRLAAIEDGLSRDDPRLGRILSRPMPGRRLLLAGVSMILASLVALAIGIGAQLSAACVAGWLGFFTGALIAWADLLARAGGAGSRQPG